MGNLLGISALLLLLAPCAVHAQPASSDAEGDPEARASQLRAASRREVELGHLEEAFAAIREAALLTRDPTVLLELGELADRLRLDAIALEAYEAYLARRADAPDRVAIAGRVRVLRLVLAGHRFVAAPAQGVARVDPVRVEPVLVDPPLLDWSGRPAPGTRELLPLAEWDGTLRARRPPSPDLLPASVIDPGLGQRLSPP